MMKRSHFLVGGAAGVAVAHTIGDSILAGGIVGGLAGLLPDVDHPHSAVGRLLPRWWHRLTPGHRGPTHSLVWCLALALAAHLAGAALGAAVRQRDVVDRDLRPDGDDRARHRRTVLRRGVDADHQDALRIAAANGEARCR